MCLRFKPLTEVFRKRGSTQAAPLQIFHNSAPSISNTFNMNDVSPQFLSSDQSPQSSLKSHTRLCSTHTLLLHTNVLGGHEGSGSERETTKTFNESASKLSPAVCRQSGSPTRQRAVGEVDVVDGDVSRPVEGPAGFKQHGEVLGNSTNRYLSGVPRVSMVTG